MNRDLDLNSVDPNKLLGQGGNRKQNKLFSSASDNSKKSKDLVVNFSVNDMDDDDRPVRKPATKKAQDFVIDDDDFSEDFGQDKVSDLVIQVRRVPAGAVHAEFHKSRCCGYRCVQIYRVVCIISNLPVVVVSVWLNGIEYFIQYATQWDALLTLVYFTLVFISARKDSALDSHAEQLNIIDDEMSVNTFNQHRKLARLIKCQEPRSTT